MVSSGVVVQRGTAKFQLVEKNFSVGKPYFKNIKFEAENLLWGHLRATLQF